MTARDDRPRPPTRIVVTGASGNVGTALLLRLGGDPRFRVHGVSRRPPPPEPPYTWCDWTPLDVGRPGAMAELTDVFRGADAVVHLAWQIQPSRDRAAMRRTNIGGTRAVLDAAVAAGGPHLVHQSSVGAYGAGPKTAVDEQWPTTGISSSSYSRDKSDAEAIVAAAADLLPLTVLRPGLIFQDAAASEVARYFLGPLVPSRLVSRRLARLAPVSDALAFQVVHATDVAAAIELLSSAGRSVLSTSPPCRSWTGTAGARRSAGSVRHFRWVHYALPRRPVGTPGFSRPNRAGSTSRRAHR